MECMSEVGRAGPPQAAERAGRRVTDVGRSLVTKRKRNWVDLRSKKITRRP